MCVPCRASADSTISESLKLDLAIPSAKVDEWRSFGSLDIDHLTDEDRVIAAWELVAHAALDRGDGTSQEWNAELASVHLDPHELVFNTRSKPVREVSLPLPENTDAELLRAHDGIVRLDALLDADEHERRPERQRGKGGHRHAVRLALVLCGHDRDTACEMGHCQFELRIIDGHGRTI